VLVLHYFFADAIHGESEAVVAPSDYISVGDHN
jgi:hypothetical protein